MAVEVPVPRFADKLGSPVSLTESEGKFFAFFGALALLGQKMVSLMFGRPAVRWNHLKLAKAAVALRRVAGGSRAVSDTEWSPRMGAFWKRVARSCARTSSEKLPPLRSDLSLAM